jgi:DNA-binding NarL/FixJ family response regulator
MSKKILLVDGHEFLLEGIKLLLSDSKTITQIFTDNTLKKAYEFIFSNKDCSKVDAVCIDLSMPEFKEKNIKNGQDLAFLIRKNYPQLKIVILTGSCCDQIYTEISRSIKPNGFIEKSDLKASEIEIIFEKILNGENYESENILDVSKNCDLRFKIMDEINIKIITLLSKGISTKTMEKVLPISLSAIKKRKRKIKQILEIETGNDEDIIKEAFVRKII